MAGPAGRRRRVADRGGPDGQRAARVAREVRGRIERVLRAIGPPLDGGRDGRAVAGERERRRRRVDRLGERDGEVRVAVDLVGAARSDRCRRHGGAWSPPSGGGPVQPLDDASSACPGRDRRTVKSAALSPVSVPPARARQADEGAVVAVAPCAVAGALEVVGVRRVAHEESDVDDGRRPGQRDRSGAPFWMRSGPARRRGRSRGRCPHWRTPRTGSSGSSRDRRQVDVSVQLAAPKFRAVDARAARTAVERRPSPSPLLRDLRELGRCRPPTSVVVDLVDDGGGARRGEGEGERRDGGEQEGAKNPGHIRHRMTSGHARARHQLVSCTGR